MAIAGIALLATARVMNGSLSAWVHGAAGEESGHASNPGGGLGLTATAHVHPSPSQGSIHPALSDTDRSDDGGMGADKSSTGFRTHNTSIHGPLVSETRHLANGATSAANVNPSDASLTTQQRSLEHGATATQVPLAAQLPIAVQPTVHKTARFSVRRDAGVVYGEALWRHSKDEEQFRVMNLTLDVTIPDDDVVSSGATPMPAIVMIHGGCFSIGSSEWLGSGRGGHGQATWYAYCFLLICLFLLALVCLMGLSTV